MRQIIVNEENFIPINDKELITVKNTQHYFEITSCSNNDNKYNNLSKIQRIDNDTYVNVETGEIGKYSKYLFKTERAFKKELKNIQLYIKGCFNGDESERFITLTYDEFINDFKQITKDFNNFLKKLKRRYGNLRYIYIKEAHITGSWHLHCIIKRLDEKPFDITEDELRKLWVKGKNVNVKPITNIKTLPSYFDILNNDKKKNYFMFYKSDTRIYEHSRDMKIKKERMCYGEFKKLINNKKLDYRQQSSIKCVRNNGEVIDIGTNKYEQYYINE